MEKLKKVFSPGSKKDDEVLYGNPETRRQESLANTSEQEPPKLYPTEGAAGQKESGGVLSQITGGSKYDEQRYGTTATSNPDPNKLYTNPDAPRDHTVVNQILNPGGHKYDEQRFGETAVTAGAGQHQGTGGVGEKLYPEHGVQENQQTHHPDLGNGVVNPNIKLETDPSQKDHTVLRQLLNPSGNKRDDVAFGTTAHAAGDKVGTADTGRSDHLGSGIAAAGAPSSMAASSVAPGTGATSGYSEPVLAGTGNDINPKYNEPQNHVLDRSHPLRDGTGTTTGHINPVGAPEASMTQHAAHTESIGLANVSDGSTTADNHINPIGAPHTANSTVPMATGVAATGGGLAASNQAHGSSTLGATSGGATYTDHSGNVHTSLRHPVGTKLDCDGNPVSGYVHHVAGPHSLDIANILDPNVAATPASPINLGGSTVASSSHESASVANGAGITTGANVATATGTATGAGITTGSHNNDVHEEKKKTGLLQKILHPKSHKEEKDTSSHGHGHPSTTIDDNGRNVLHKDPPQL